MLVLRLVALALTVALLSFGFAPAVARADSSAVRATKSWQAGMRWGRFLGGIDGIGVDAAYVDGASRQFGLSVMNGRADLRPGVREEDAELVELTRFAVEAWSLALEARFFLTGTLHVTTGLGVRRLGFSMDLKARDGSSDVAASARSTSLTARLDIGNLWTWDNGFNIGIDWIGYTQPLAHTYASSVRTAGSATDAVQEVSAIVDTAARDLGAMPTAQLLVVHAGFLF